VPGGVNAAAYGIIGDVNKMAELAEKLTGTFLPEKSRPPVVEWLQGQLRKGYLRPVLERFVDAQPEQLDCERVQVDEVTATTLHCRIPRFVVDHESTRPLRDDVEFDLNPLSGEALRCRG
jgi:hypothetical protein